MNEILLKQFKDLGFSASYHFADDTGKEAQLGYIDQVAAINLYFAHPELQEEMLEISKAFLWSLTTTLNSPRWKDYNGKS